MIFDLIQLYGLKSWMQVRPLAFLDVIGIDCCQNSLGLKALNCPLRFQVLFKIFDLGAVSYYLLPISDTSEDDLYLQE